MALATRELELILIAKDHTKATMARIAGSFVILGGALTALGLKGAREFGEMTREALEFRQQMALAVTQADGLGATIENVGDIVNRVGTNLPVPFEELSDSLFDIFSTFTSDQLDNLEDAEKILRAFGEAAVAGQAPMRAIGRAAIAWINALDQPATLENINKILDVQFELVRKGAGTYEEFAGQIGKAIPAFVGAGQTVDTFGGSLAFLTKNGLSAAMAATSAARAVELMFSPKAIKGLAAVGVEIENGNGEFRQMNEILTDLVPVFDGLSASQKKIKFKEIFGTGRIQARRFFDIALPNIAEFNELVDDMKLSAGEAAEAFELLFGQPLSQMQLFQNRLEFVRREFGDQFIKVLEERVFPALQILWDWWQDLDDGAKELIIRLSALTVAFSIVAGIILIAVGFFLLFVTLLQTFSGTSAIAGLVKLGFMLGWVGVLLAAVALAAFLIFKNWDKVWPFLVGIWEKITEAVGNFVEANSEFFEQVREKAVVIFEKVLELGTAIWNRAVAIWEFIWAGYLVFWEKWGEDILGTIGRVWEILKGIFLDAMDVIIGILDFFIALFNGDWAALWEAVKDIAGAAWQVILGVFAFWFEVISQAWRVFWDNLKQTAADIWNGIFEFLRGIWESIASTASGIWNGIVDFFRGIWESITQTAKDTIGGRGGLLEFIQGIPGAIIANLFEMTGMAIEWGGKIIGWILEGIITFGPELFLWFFTLPGKIMGAIPNMIGLLFNVGWTVLKGLWNGVVWVWSSVLWPWLRALPGRIWSAIGPGAMSNLLWGIGGTLLQGFLGGIRWVWNNLLLPWARGIGTAIKNGVGNLFWKLWGAGKAVIDGLWGGMKSKWKEVTSWLGRLNPRSWFNDINVLRGHAIKNLVHTGEDVMQGLHKGMLSGWEKNVQWLGGINVAGTGIASGLTTSAMRVGEGATTNDNSQSQTFQFGDIISNADPQEIAAEIGWQTRML